MQYEVHARDGRGGEVFFLAEDLPEEGSSIAPGKLHVFDGAKEHAAGAASRVVNALAGLRVEQVHHHPNDAPGRVELARLLPLGDVSELADQVLVGVAED